MRFRRPVPAVTAALEDAPAPVLPRFRWLKRGMILCGLLWLGMLVTWLVLDHIAQRRLAAEIDAARGEPLRLADFDPPTIPETENALFYIRQAIDQYRSNSLDNSSWYEYPLEPESLAQVRAHLTLNANTVKLLHRAAQCKQVRWPVARGGTNPYSTTQTDLYDYLNPLREMGNLLRLAALTAHEDGDEAACIAYVQDGLEIGRIADEQPLVYPHLVASGIESIGSGTVTEITSRPLRPATRPAPPEQIKALMGRLYLLDDGPRKARARRAYLGERAAMLESLVLRPDSFTQAMSGQMVREPVTWQARAMHKLLTPHQTLHAAESFRVITLTARAVASDDWASARRMLPATPGARSFQTPLSQWMQTSQFNPGYVQWEFFMVPQRRLSAVLLAIRLYQRDHGALPPDLQALVPKYLPAVPLDPYASPPAPMRYVRDVKFPFVYSLGMNGRDDVATGFAPTTKNNNNFQSPDYLLFIDPIEQRKSEEQPAPPTATAPASAPTDELY
jgi:hypothetical protein